MLIHWVYLGGIYVLTAAAQVRLREPSAKVFQQAQSNLFFNDDSVEAEHNSINL